MSVQIKIPTVFRSHVNGEKSVEVAGGTLKQVLEKVGQAYPTLGAQIWGDNGGLHRFVNVYVNDEDVRYMNGLETSVRDGDVVSILPAVAGGASVSRA